jgi:hypothetical protein
MRKWQSLLIIGVAAAAALAVGLGAQAGPAPVDQALGGWSHAPAHAP